MKKVFIAALLLIVSFAKAQDFNAFYSTAQKAFESRMYRKAYDNATKALELNGGSTEARWLRIKSSLTANAPKERLITAIDDLNFLSKSESSGNVYKTLGIAESELASYIYNFNQTEAGYLNQSSIHYENAKRAYIRASELSPELTSKVTYDIKAIDNKIAEIKREMNKIN